MADLPESPVYIGTLKRVMSTLAYFSDWDVDRIRSVEAHCRMVTAPAKTEVIATHDLSPFSYFLIDGRVILEPETGTARSLEAGTLDAGFPIAHLRPSRYRVTTDTPTRLLRIESSSLRCVPRSRPARYRVAQEIVGGSWQNHPMVVDLMTRRRNDQLPLPAIPGVAMKIRKALAREDFDLGHIATVIGADPAIAAGMIKMANSALFGGQTRCDSVQSALVRLGAANTHALVLSLSSRELFKATLPVVKERMVERWRHAIDIASLSAVLGKMTPGLDTDQALLVGLLHEVGAIPVLRLAEDYPDLADTPGVIDEALAALVPELSAELLAAWGFPETFATAAREQNNWFYDHQGPVEHADMLIVAHLHALAREREFQQLPRLDETPAFNRLATGLLSPRMSLVVLDEARTQIKELRALLR